MEWFKTWFNTKYYHILYNNRDHDEARSFIVHLLGELSLVKGSRVIDLACGKGRHSLFLNSLGYDVLGLDLSERCIEHNKQFENEALHFAVHDMRDPIDGPSADAVVNLFTSFGYFDNPSDDEKVFESVYSILKTGGLFVLDFLNAPFVQSRLTPTEVVNREGIDFLIDKSIQNGTVIKRIRFEVEGNQHEYFEKVKLHTLDEILVLGHSQGFTSIRKFGDYYLNSYDAQNSPRCIVVFQKQ